MTVTIGRHNADGLFTDISQIYAGSGVYIIVCWAMHSTGNYKIIDIGESGNIRERISGHDRKSQWSNYCTQTIAFATIPIATETQRRQVERELRQQIKPPCGER